LSCYFSTYDGLNVKPYIAYEFIITHSCYHRR
jgi:hypothetical protein